MKEEYDIAILGGGPAGYPAAIRAAQKGARVCVVEKDALGGTCLNRGCIPTKVLHAKAHLIESMKEASRAGVAYKGVSIDSDILYSFKTKVVSELVRGVETLFKGWKIKLVRGTGRLTKGGEIDVEDYGTVKAARVIVATGSKEAVVPGMEFDGKVVLSSRDMLELDGLPTSLVIVGGGVIGCEFGSIFNAFGTDVTIVEMLPRLIATEDVQISRALQTYLRKRGIKLHLGTKVTSIGKTASGAVVELESGESIEAEKVLVSVGRLPLVDGAGLEEAGVEFTEKGIAVDEGMRTSVEGVYAAGDVIGGWLLAHVATREGIVATENALGASLKVDYSTIPTTIYTIPEVSRVGMTEDEAREKEVDVVTGRFPFAANGKAKGLQETEGFVKWVAGKGDRRLLGLHIIGPSATELLASGIVAIKNGLSVDDYVSAVFPHPTLSESLLESAESVIGKAIHIR